ncbi:toll/interleukin-1 receptor domain-containing protein [Segetibacter aerophilus]|uniref:TIR domain-containing protein n=1 Tax=Segetibacter aerophilus TaxID=670293 RepID=A0A512B8A5_9BACT|nr:toll/interleukin-1 receptor domain-containing protein [Segetibacter aerophilus]GEO08188.1 hypothetical protein SAE01_06840 [Segetibacter aerophilus]
MIFISYSKDDIQWRERITKHLRENEIIYNRKITFQDSNITSGEDFQEAIDSHLATATVVILLVSSSYLGSEYIKRYELDPLLKRRDVKIYWFLLSSCLWDKTGLANLQCANTVQGERIVSLNELYQNGKEEEINKILSTKCREIFEYASDKGKNFIRTPKEFIYKCNRKVESQFFQMVYTERFTEKELLAYSIIGDKEDSLNNLHNAIKLKVLVNDYKNYEIHDILMPGIDVNTYFTPEQNLYLFKKQFLNSLSIAYDVSKVKQWSIDQVLQQLKKRLNKQGPKQVYFISIKIESTAFQAEAFVQMLKWLNCHMLCNQESRYQLKIFYLFTFEKSNDQNCDQQVVDFLGNYCKNTRVEKVLKGEEDLIAYPKECLPLIFLGEHRLADQKSLIDWYEQDYKQWLESKNIEIDDDMDNNFEVVKKKIFSAAQQAKMRIVEKNLTSFLKY